MSTTVATETKCSKCGEAVHWSGGWLHDRTNDRKCQPLCTTKGCTKPATAKLGYYGFAGDGARFIRTGWACKAHEPFGWEHL